MSELLPTIIPAFYITVDNKKYGPFFSQEDEKVKRLLHLRGVTVNHVMIRAPDKNKPKKKKGFQPSLLDGLNWYPVRKG